MQAKSRESWAAVGIDTSLTAVSVVCVMYDGLLDKRIGPEWVEYRWLPEDMPGGTDYFTRLGQAAKTHVLILDVLRRMYRIPAKLHIGIEDPWYYGATKRGMSAWLMQQAEVAGAVKGSLVRHGFRNLESVNNATWKKAIRERYDIKIPAKSDVAKWVIKEWATEFYGMPELPDLVKSKSGAKIPRPETGYGAKAKPEQPLDVYDAAGVCFYIESTMEV
jgi:hypothetical protein